MDIELKKYKKCTVEIVREVDNDITIITKIIKPEEYIRAKKKREVRKLAKDYGQERQGDIMKKMLIWDEYDNCYKKVIDVEELKKYIEDLIIEVKKEQVEGIITEESLKASIINILNKTIEDLEVEDEQRDD